MAKITNEFMIRYLDNIEEYEEIISSSCKKWSQPLEKQLKRNIKNINREKELGGIEHGYTDVLFNNGSMVYLLFIPKTIGTFELHTIIRECFSDSIKDSENIWFNLAGLDEDLQRELVSALSGCVKLYGWSIPKWSNNRMEIPNKINYGFKSNLEDDELADLIFEGEQIADGTNLARRLAYTPTNYMTSEDLVKEAKKLAKELKVDFEFYSEETLEDMGCESFLSVIRGTRGSDGGIAQLSYNAGEEYDTIAIVGKGIVFDTGGYNIKSDGFMKDMHRDMTGAAVSMGLFRALVKTKQPVNIHLFLAIGENLISEAAFKPNEVVAAMDKTTIEVSDTDAEGRMVLIDTILMAQQYEPSTILTFATLTGAAVYSIDTRFSCTFSNHKELLPKTMEIGYKCGERVWPFPIELDFIETLKSEVADISQCTSSDNAEHIYAACLLNNFIDKDIKWVHVDLSSESNKDGLGLVNTSVSGFGVRWGYSYIKELLEG